MGATQNKRVDILCKKRSKVAVDDLVGDGIVEHPFLYERYQERTCSVDLRLGVTKSMDGTLVSAACDCGARADDANPTVARDAKGGFCTGRDDTLDRNIEKLLHPRHGEGGSGVASDDNHLGLLGKKEAADSMLLPLGSFPAFTPVREGVLYRRCKKSSRRADAS